MDVGKSKAAKPSPKTQPICDESLRAKANMIRMFGEFVDPDEGRSYKAYTMGWMYRTQEFTAALARTQLKKARPVQWDLQLQWRLFDRRTREDQGNRSASHAT